MHDARSKPIANAQDSQARLSLNLCSPAFKLHTPFVVMPCHTLNAGTQCDAVHAAAAPGVITFQHALVAFATQQSILHSV